MRPEVQEGLADAHRHRRIAEELLASGDADDVAASRAYYAMFYAAEALLLSMDLTFSKHQAVIAAFGLHFAKTGVLPPELHGYLNDAFRLRQVADYARGVSVSRGDAVLAVEKAGEFISAIEEYLSQRPG